MVGQGGWGKLLSQSIRGKSPSGLRLGVPATKTQKTKKKRRCDRGKEGGGMVNPLKQMQGKNEDVNGSPN